MIITFDSIVSLLKSKGLDFSTEGDEISVKNIAAIGPDIEGVEGLICYYVGDDASHLTGVKKSIVICKPGLKFDLINKNTYIYTNYPQLCFYHISSLFKEAPEIGVHSQSIIDESTIIGHDVSIGPFCEIAKCKIGNNVIIESGVKVYKGTVIGSNVQIQSNSVIGATGVMWTWDNDENKIRCVQTGHVIIEDNVFVGSGVGIVRGAFENKPTIICRDTMIAHGTMIGHGSIIGVSNHFANNVSIAGSVKTGKNCFFGSGSIVRPHINLPDDTVVGAGAVVVKDLSEVGITLIGNPARKLVKKKNTLSGVPAPYST
jgi:UDP-3-O-[3-hydroxymyristoyl] glucosamine N-acyltransferase